MTLSEQQNNLLNDFFKSDKVEQGAAIQEKLFSVTIKDASIVFFKKRGYINIQERDRYTIDRHMFDEKLVVLFGVFRRINNPKEQKCIVRQYGYISADDTSDLKENLPKKFINGY